MKVFDHEIDTPIVGEFYNVRCAIIENECKEIHVPIIGKAHTDAQFKVNHEHYHIDGRFTDFYVDSEGKTNVVLTTDADYSFEKIKGYSIKRRKCRRLTTGVKPPETMRYTHSECHDWYKGMVGKSCLGRKCPHLGTKMIEVNGRLECPLHKLQGSIETETILDIDFGKNSLWKLSENFNKFLES